MNNRFSRDLEYSESPKHRIDWLDRFADEYHSALQNNIQSNFTNYLDQINGIIGKKGTVESIVQEYQKATGLQQYLNSLSAQDNEQVKQANQILLPTKSQELNDKILKFVENRIRSFKGNIHLPALLNDIQTHFPDLTTEEIYDNNLMRALNNLILEEKKIHPVVDNDDNAGEIDFSTSEIDTLSNSDLFFNMEPKNQ